MSGLVACSAGRMEKRCCLGAERTWQIKVKKLKAKHAEGQIKCTTGALSNLNPLLHVRKVKKVGHRSIHLSIIRAALQPGVLWGLESARPFDR